MLCMDAAFCNGADHIGEGDSYEIVKWAAAGWLYYDDHRKNDENRILACVMKKRTTRKITGGARALAAPPRALAAPLARPPQAAGTVTRPGE